MGEVSYLSLLSEVWNNKFEWMPLLKAYILVAVVNHFIFPMLLFLEVIVYEPELEAGLVSLIPSVEFIIAILVMIILYALVSLFAVGHYITLLHDRINATNDQKTKSIGQKMWIGLRGSLVSFATILIFIIPVLIVSLILFILILIGWIPLVYFWMLCGLLMGIIWIQFAQSYKMGDGFKYGKAYASLKSSFGKISILGLVWFGLSMAAMLIISLVFMLPIVFLQVTGSFPYILYGLQTLQYILIMISSVILWVAGMYGLIDITR